MPLSEIDLDEVYTDLCYRMSEAGDERTADVLARLALLLMHEVGDAARIRRAIDAALEGIPKTVTIERPVGLG